MLTSDLAMSWRRGRRTGPRYVEPDDAEFLQAAADLISIVREHRDRRRRELDRALEEYVGVMTEYRTLRGFIKLLLDRCLFETASAADPAEIRRALFFKAREHHPVTRNEEARQQIIREAATEVGCAPEEITEYLYADLSNNQRLTDFEDIGASELLDRYNLAQAQALLYRSIEMRLQVEPQPSASLRQLFDAIKAYRLIHLIQGSSAKGYDIRLSGPVSIFHRSQKYGVQMAVFLPALLLCKGWRMQAEIETKKGGSAFFELASDQNRLRSHYVASDYENPLVEKLISSQAAADEGWRLEACREVLDLGESAFIPDLTIRRPDGRRVYVEILGFWTPRYLGERLKEFERGGFNNFVLAASEELRGSRDPASKLPPNVVLYKTSLNAESLRRAAADLALE
jgi:predicted nuclease of restriction endonuclease-like RecB superfamily